MAKENIEWLMLWSFGYCNEHNSGFMHDLPKLLLLPSLLLLAPNRSSDDSSLSDVACSRLGLSLMLVFPATPAGRGGGRRSNPLPPADRPLRAPPLPLADHPLRAPPAVSGGLPGPRRLAGMGGMLCDFHGSCEGAAILHIKYCIGVAQ